VFFKAVKKGDNCPTVHKIDGGQLPLLSPGLDGRPNSFKLETEFAHRRKVGVGRANTVPVAGDKRGKGGVGKPGVFHPENITPGGLRRGL
jgi:hypothetical protein